MYYFENPDVAIVPFPVWCYLICVSDSVIDGKQLHLHRQIEVLCTSNAALNTNQRRRGCCENALIDYNRSAAERCAAETHAVEFGGERGSYKHLSLSLLIRK